MTSLLNTNGLVAIVIACAAFCIPISMVIVFFSLLLSLSGKLNNRATMMANIISMVIINPNLLKLLQIASVFWK